ncbi:MAG: bifunctional riboflavin kinase / FMN adenylyltransferase RibF [Bacteroidetes bacterium HLUCCA01]|nr:MAG: bifunctional riboflavin kinase / FMN adenylyltransferase RibF [Bacteroidetes bacterium HLUCCA01]
MENLVYLSEVEKNPNTVLTVGSFDGVHAGHRSIIQTVVKKAANHGARSILVTFDPHPRDIINPGKDGIQLLTTLEERAGILNELGIDQMVVIPFTRDFSLLTSEQFIRDIIWQKIGVREFVIGYDHQFGRNREGTIYSLRQMSAQLGFDVHVVEAHEVQHVTVSSTIVRRKLQDEGDIILAREFLGRPYQLRGTVIHGDKRGRTIGYPTANIKPAEKRKIIPKNGVYAVNVRIEGSANEYRGMMNIGFRPTFKEEDLRTLEVHIMGFNEEIYGKTLTLSFLRRIRDEQPFNGIDALREQLHIDRQACLEID